MDKKRRHSGLPTASSVSLLEEVDWNECSERCTLAAKQFSKSRDGIFSRAYQATKELLDCMNQIDTYKNGTAIKYILSQVVSKRIMEAVTGPVQGINQIICGGNSDLFFEIAKLVVKWCLGPKSWSIDSGIINSINNAIHEWNKYSQMKGMEVCVLVPLHFVCFPEPSSTQREEWYGSFDEPISPDVQVKVELGDNTLIKHATSTLNAIKILRTLQNDTLTISANQGVSRAHPFCPLVWCGVKLTAEEVEKIPNECKKHVQSNRYGGVIFEFPIKATRIRNDPRAFVFGTRKYTCEYSQAILIPEAKSPVNVKLYTLKEDKTDKSKELYELESIPDILKYNWKAGYNKNGGWTHPELVFAGDLKIQLQNLKIRFSKHTCITSKQPGCFDCNTKIDEIMNNKVNFEQLLAMHAPDSINKRQWKWNTEDGVNSGYYTFNKTDPSN